MTERDRVCFYPAREKVQPIPDEEESQTYQSAIHANFPQFVGEL